ncbi:MAG TPA: hypothetical protein VMF32_04150 [Xanthobacteraceae bacterium]|nr:hypothetical protein [Xanthobacteraceae bacterium]
MRRLRSGFAVEVFEQANARSERLAGFLQVYVRNFSPEYRTKTNELLDFLERPPPDRDIVYFGLTYRGVACGFATLMYYPDGPLAIVDHLVIAPNMRGYGAFFTFCDLIANYIEEKPLVFDHLLAEVILSDRATTEHIASTLLIRLMRIVGFRIARLPYWAPDPSIVHDREGCKAALLFLSQPERVEIPAGEFITVVEIIYRIHYSRWYQRVMSSDRFMKYSSTIEAILEEIRSKAALENRIFLNGMKNLDLQFSFDPNPRTDLSTLGYMVLLSIPAAVTVAVALTQDIWVTAVSAAAAVCIIGIFAVHPRLRRPLRKFFRLGE